MIIILVLGLAVSAWGSRTAYNWQLADLQRQFSDSAAGNARALEAELDKTLFALRSVRAVFAASQAVERDEFRAFVQGLQPSNVVQAFEWIPRVRSHERRAYEAQARQDGFDDFTLTQRSSERGLTAAESRAEYFPVYYVEPYEGNESALGFDLASNQIRLDALTKSRDSGSMVASARINLVQETGDQYGILGFLPFYGTGIEPNTPSERQRRLQGFVLGVFRIGSIVSSLLSGRGAEHLTTRTYLFDRSAAPENQLLYPKSATSQELSRIAAQTPFTLKFPVADRQWEVVMLPPEQYYWQNVTHHWFVLAAGAAITLILAWYFASVIRRTEVVEGQVLQRTIDLKRSNLELEHFASAASHDLQEPARKMKTFASLIVERYADRLDERGTDYLHRIQEASIRMQDLINDLLALSRVSSAERNDAEIDLNAVVQNVLTDLELKVQDSNAEVTADDLPAIKANESQMRQLFQNLIENALKYREKNKSPVIRITAQAEPKPAKFASESNGWRIEVADNGIGFEPEYAERIFGAFQRLHGRGEYEGSGVGLAVCQRICERHGGTISATSQPGEGSTFTITLPATPPAEERTQ